MTSLVFDRAAGLDDGDDAGFVGDFDVVRLREERVGGEHGALRARRRLWPRRVLLASTRE